MYFSFVELDVPNACQTHTLGVLRGFSQNGCRVDALIPRSLYVRPKIPNVTFYYLWPWRFSFLGRVCVKFLCGLKMFILCLKNKYDFIYVREMEANPVPRLCSKMFRIPLYIEINDLIVPVLMEDNAPWLFLRAAKRNQELDFRQSIGLIVPSVPMRDWIIDHYDLPEDKVHMILNGTEILNSNKLSQSKVRKGLGIPAYSFCIGFLGNIYKRYDFDSMFKAILRCQDEIPNLYFIIIGDGPMAGELKRKISELGLEKKTILAGYVQSIELDTILPAVDVGLLLLTKEDVLRYGPTSTKLSTYGIYNLAVITAGYSMDGYPDELAQGLFVVPPEDPRQLADKLLWIHDHPEEKEEKSKKLHDFVIKNLTWEAVTKEIIDVVYHDKQL